MEERFPASVLVLAGLLRVAGASRVEPWSSHPTDQSSLEEGLVTATFRLAPVREEDPTQAAFPFDSSTSDFPNDGVSDLHEIIRTEAGENSDDGGQPLTFPDRPPGRSEPPFSERSLLGRQSKESSTGRPQISRGTSSGLSETVVEPADQPEALTTFLPRGGRTGNATGHDLGASGKPSSLVPTKGPEVDLLTPWQPEPLESARPKTAEDSSPSLATRPGNSHTFTSGSNAAKSGVVLDEAKSTPAKGRLGDRVMFLPSDSQQPLVNGGQTQAGLRTSEVPRAPGFSVEALLNFSALFQQRSLSEEHVATQQPDSASSPHGKTTRHEAVGLRTAETPAAPTPSQSHTHSSSFLVTPETLSSGTPPLSAVPRETGQRDPPGSVFRSSFPISGNAGVPEGTEEHLRENTPLTLQRETQPQTATQPSHFKLPQITAALRDPPFVSDVQETTPEVPVPTHEQPQLSTMLATAFGQARGRGLSMSPLGKVTSLHAHPTMPHVAAASHVQPPSSDLPAAAGRITQGTSEIPLPSTIPPLAPKQLVSLSTSAPPLTELFASSSASVPAKSPTPGVPATMLGMVASLPTAPQHESEVLSLSMAASVPALLPTPGSLAFASIGPRSSATADSAHATPRPAGLSATVYSKPQGTALGTPFQAEHQTLGSSVSAPNGPAVPETTVPSAVETGAAAAGSNVPATAVHDCTESKLPPALSRPSDAVTQSLPIGAYAHLQSATPSVRAPGPQVPLLRVTLPIHSESQKPAAPASLMKEPQLSPTPVLAHAELNTEEARAEGSLPVSTTARASSPTHARAPLVFSAHAQTRRHLSHASVQLGDRTVARGAQTPNSPAFSAVQLHGLLRPQPSRSPISLQTELQSPAVLTSAEAATPNPKVDNITVHPNPHLPTALGLPGIHHATAKAEEREGSLPSSLAASQPGIHSTPLRGVSAAVPSRKSEGQDQSSGAPHLSNLAPQTVHHKNVNLSILNSVHVAEHFPGVRAIPVLAEDEAQDLLQSPRGFLLHLLNQSDVTVNGNLDSAEATSYLGSPPSLQYLSFLIRGAENMICLQPMQNTTPLSGGPDATGPGGTSFQEMLISSTFLGLSHPGASSLMQMSPSSVLLVKPMFVFLPADGPEDPALHSAEGEEEHTDGHPFPNAAILRLVASSFEQLAGSDSTIGQSTKADSLSTERQAVSGSVISSVPEYSMGSGQVRSTTLKAEPFPDQPREVAATRTKSLESGDQEEGFLLSILDPPKSGENKTILLPVEHHGSATPPTMASAHQRPQTLPSTSGLLSSPLRITSLPSAMEHSTSLMLTRASRPEPQSQLNTTLMLHAEADRPLGSTTPMTSSSKNFGEPLSTSSAGNMDLPSEAVKNLTSLRAGSHRFLITQVSRKNPSEIQHMPPTTVSDLLTFSTVKDLKESTAANYPYSEAIPALPRATETSSYAVNGTLAKVSKSPVSSPVPPRASERPRTSPLPTPFLAYTQAHTPLSEEHLKDTNLQVRSRPPVSVSSQASTDPYFATAAMKDHQATLMPTGRNTLTSKEGKTGSTVNNETGKHVRDPETHNPRGAVPFTRTTPGTAHALLSPTGLSSAPVAFGDVVGSVGLQRTIHKAPLTTLHPLSPSPAHKDMTALPTSGRAPPSEVPLTKLRSLQFSTTAATDKAVFSSPLTAKEELIQHGGGQKADVSPSFPTSSLLEGGHQDGARLLKYEQTQDSGSSVLSPNTTSSSLGSSVVNKAPAFFETTLSSGVPSDGPADKVLDQTFHLRSLPLDTSERTFPPLPIPYSLEGDLQDTARPLKYEQTQDSGSSVLSPNSTSSSVANQAPALFVTTVSSGVPSDGPVDKVLDQTFHLRSLPLDTSETTFPPLPTPSSLQGDLQDIARPLKYEQDSGSSAPSPNSTSSPLGSSVATKAPAFFLTMLSSGVPSDGPVDKVLHQTFHLRSLPLDTSETTNPPLPTPSSLQGDLQDRARPLKYEQTQDSGSFAPSPSSTSSSLRSSVVNKAPAFFVTTVSSGVPSDEPADKVLDQAFHLRSLPLDTSETTFPPLPTTSSLEGDLQDRAKPLKYEQTQDSGSSLLSPNSTSSSLRSSVATKAPAFFLTTVSLGVPSDGPADKVLNPAFHLRSLPLDTSETTFPSLPTPSSLQGDLQDTARPLKYEQTQDSGSFAPSPISMSSSLWSSVANKAPAFFLTTVSSGVPSDGPVDKVLDEAFHLRSLPLDTSERTFPPLPTPSSLQGNLQDTARLLKYEQTQDSGSFALSPNNISSSFGSSVATKASAFFETTLSSGVPSYGPAEKILDQASHLRSLPLDTSETTFPPLPTPSSLQGNLQDTARPLKYEQTQDSGSSALSPNSTSSSLRSSVANKAPAFFVTAVSSRVPSDGPTDKVLDQAFLLRSLPLDNSERTFPPLPTPSSLQGDLQDTARPLKYEQIQDSGSSVLSPNSTSSSGSSVANHAPAFFVTTVSSGVPSDGPVDRVLDQAFHLRSLPLDTSKTTFPPLPTPSSLQGDLQDTARPLKYEQTQDSGSFALSPNNISSSFGSSVATKAPAFFETTLSSGVPSDGPADKVLDQTFHLRSLPLDTSERTLRLHTQVLLSLESLSDTPEMTAKGDFMVEATSAGVLEDSYLHTVGEPVTVLMDATEATTEDSQVVLQQSDSSLLEWKMYHRRPTRSDDVFLDGSAVVSDDACGSGNYTSEMSLRRAGGQPPSHPDSFLALIVLQSNRSRPTLRVKSCCVTPTARPTGLDAACCLFPRTPLECRYIQLQPNDEPQTASFTIQLFRMLNHSVAYLHCELSICLNNHPGCEQRCSESRETHFKPRDQSSYQTLHNLISFGPVLKAQHEFPSEVAAGSEQAMMFPVLLGSLAGTAVLLGISIFIWFHQRSKIKTEADLEGLCTP